MPVLLQMCEEKKQKANQKSKIGNKTRQSCMAAPIGEKCWILDLPIVHYGLGLAGAERRHRAVVAVVCSSIHNSTDWRVNYCNLQMTIIIVIFFFRSTNHLCRLPPCPRSRPGGTVRCWCPRSCGTGTCPAAPPGTPTPSRRQTENIPRKFLNSDIDTVMTTTTLPVRTACTRRGRACWRAPGATPAGPPSPRRAATPRPG